MTSCPSQDLTSWYHHLGDQVSASVGGAQTSRCSKDKQETDPRGSHTTGFDGTRWGCLSGMFARTLVRGSDTFLEAHGSGKKRGGKEYSLKKENLQKPRPKKKQRIYEIIQYVQSGKSQGHFRPSRSLDLTLVNRE